MLHVKIEAYHDGEMWCARGIRESVFTQGKTYDELLENIKEAVALHFEEEIEKGEKVDVQIVPIDKRDMARRAVNTLRKLKGCLKEAYPNVTSVELQHRGKEMW